MQARGGGAAQRVGGHHLLWNVKVKIKHIANVNDIYGPRKISHVRNSESVFLDTFTTLLK